MERFQTFVTKNSFFIGFLFVALGLIGYIMNFTGSLSSSNSDWGTFGDYLNGVTTPILGIIGIVLTYSILNNQNKESRQSEFKYMFQMLFESLEVKKDLIIVKKGKRNFKGRDAIKLINNDFKALIRYQKKQKTLRPIGEIVSHSFWSVYDDLDGSFAIYMKNMHNCLKVIDKFCEKEHKKTYADLIRAQMDSEDMIFLLYNGIGSTKFSDFKERIEKYTMLQDIANSTSVDPEIKGLYRNQAYNDQN
jgi:hypothetical protein